MNNKKTKVNNKNTKKGDSKRTTSNSKKKSTNKVAPKKAVKKTAKTVSKKTTATTAPKKATKKNVTKKSTVKTVPSKVVTQPKKIKRKKGFTLVELIVVIVVIGILTLLIVPRVENLISSGKNKYYATIEKEMILLARDYYTEEVKKLPASNSSKELTAGDLLYGDYINEMFKDAKGMPCNNSFIIVSNVGNKKYSYEACLYCEDYETTSETCRERKAAAAQTSVIAVTRNHQVLEPITNEEINSIKDDLINRYSYINNTITREDIVLDLTKVNINTLGNYIFTYIIPKANIYKYEGVIKVRDLIPPTITGDVIYTIKGQPIDIWNYITVSDNFYSVDEITKGYTEIDQVNINVPGSYRVKITATDKGGNKKEKEVLVKVIERIATFTPSEGDWTRDSHETTVTINNIAGLEVASWKYKKGILGQEGTNWGSAIVGTGTSADITLSENGINIIEIEITYKDGTVFVQQSGQYKIDKESPSCGGVSGGSTTWTNQDKTLSVGCVDNLSGCNQTSFSKSYNTTIKTDTITIQDSVGNETVCPVNVYIDKIKPTCGSITTVPSGASNTSWVSGQRQVNIGCNDSDSLCTSTTYTKTYTSSQTTGEIIIKDNANNQETCTVPVYLDTDTPTKPTITGTTASNVETYSNTLTIKGGSSLSGIKKREYCIMTSNTTEGCIWTEYKDPFLQADEGEYYVFSRAVNNANIAGIISDPYIVKIVYPTIIFDRNCGTGSMNPISGKSLTSIKLPRNTFEKEGYIFKGWNTKIDGTGMALADGDNVLMGRDLTLYAQWEKVITLTQKHGTSTTTQNYILKNCENNHTFTLTSSADEFSGWTFQGWTDGPTPKAPDYGKTANITISDDKTVYATYSRVFTATFIDYSGTAKQTRTVSGTAYGNNGAGGVSNQYETKKSPVQSNYTGWTKQEWTTSDAAGASSTLNSNSDVILSSNVTYYGLYSQNVTLTYNANGGLSTPSSQTGIRRTNSASISTYSNPTFTLAAAITRDGHTFNGWSISSPINATKSAGSTITPTSGTSITASASWIRKTYTVNYYQGNGTSTAGSTKLGSTTCTFTEDCTLDAYSGTFPLSSNKWTFYGWSTSQTGTTRTYQNQAIINPETYTSTINLYAIGTRKFRFSSGETPTSATEIDQIWNPYSTSTGYVTGVNVPTPTSMNGWTTQGYTTSTNTGTVAISSYGPTKLAPNNYTNLEFVGKYSRTLTLAYNANGGTGTVASQTGTQYYSSGYGKNSANTGATTIAPSFTLKNNEFTYTGYTFNKWAAGSTTGTLYAAGSTYTGFNPTVSSTTTTQTMYASWNINKLTLTYNGNGGTWASTNTSFSADASGNVLRNGSLYKTEVSYGAVVNSSSGLDNYNNASWIKFEKTSYIGESGKEWYIENGSTKTYFNQDDKTVTANQLATAGGCNLATESCSVTAKVNWKINTYTVEYYQGTTKLGSSTCTYDTSCTLSSYNGTKPSGWTSFYGWTTSTSSTTRGYTNGQSVTNLASTAGGTVKLYAIFSRTINVYSGTNKATNNSKTQYYNPYATSQVTSIALTTPAAITNWTVVGYRDDATAGDKEYTSTATVTPAYNATPTYYAVYSRNYTAHFYSGINKGTDKTKVSDTVYYNTNTTSTPTQVSITLDTQANSADITNWTELGWRKDTTADNKEYAYEGTATVDFGTNFYSVYKRTLTISYDKNNSNASGTTASTTKNIYLNSNSTSTSSQQVTLASNGFTYSGYGFAGWTIDGTDYSETGVYNPALAYNASSFSKTAKAKWGGTQYTINYYLGNGTSTAGNTKIGSSTCTFGGSCTLPAFSSFNKTFPLSSNKWTFYGWGTSQTTTTRTYANQGTINPSTYSATVSLYAIGSRKFRFSSGVAPTSATEINQYWNPYSTSTSYLTAVNVPTPTAINGWTALGYRATATADSNVTISSYGNQTYAAGTYTDLEFRGKYQRDAKIVLTYNTSGGTPVPSNQEATQYYSSGYGTGSANTGAIVSTPSFTLASAPTLTGYTFSKWADGSTSGTKYSAGATYTGFAPAVTSTTVTKTMYAVYTANTYTISFNSNNGSGGQTANVTATYGSAMPTISSTAPTRTGYTFQGWYDNATYTNGTQYYTAAGASARNWDKTSATTLYAGWKANTYTVSFNANNGSGGQTANVTATYGSAMPTISSTAPTRTGYTFQGWYDNATYTNGTQYYTAAGASARNWDKTSATTLYAGWKANTYTVNYYQGNNSTTAGSTKLGSSSHTYGVAKALTTYATLGGTAPSGWTFAGWSTTQTGTSVNYTDGQSVSNLSSTNNGTVNLYAIFTRTITYNCGLNKAVNSTATQRYNPYKTTGYITAVSAPALTTIDGWTKLGYRGDTTASTATYAVTGTSAVNITPAYNASTTLYCVYGKSYTANFYSGASKATTKTKTSSTAYYNSNAASLPTTVSITLDTQANSTDITNWTELGWRKDTTADDKEYAYEASATVAFGTNFYSVYTRTLKINYDSNGGSGSMNATTKTIYLNTNQTSTSNQAVTLVANGFTAPSGYSFDKWTIDGTTYAAGASYNPTLAYNASSFEKTATAKWVGKTYTVNYYQGNGTSTAGSTKLGSTTCTFGTACTLKTYVNLGGKFPYSADDSNTNYGWTFAGWSTTQTGTDRTYGNGAQINPTTYKTIDLYAVGQKGFAFNTGKAPTTPVSTQTQYWNPYSTSTNYMTPITVGTKTDITGWTFCGYIAGSNTASESTCNNSTFTASQSGQSVTPSYNTWGTSRSVYNRTITMTFSANGGSGTVNNLTKTQYYNSGYGSSGSNTGANVSTVSFTLPSNGFTAPTGYKFGGWKIDGTTYAVGATYNYSPTVDSTAITVAVTPIWTAHTYTVKYYQGNNSTTAGSTAFSTTSSHTYGTSKTLTTYATLGGTAPSGWTFAGWSTTQTGTSVTYTDGQSVSNLTTTDGGTVNLYAVFKKTYTFKSGASCGTSSSATTQYYNPYKTTGYLTSITAPALTAISGWNGIGYRTDTTAGNKEYEVGSITPAYNATSVIDAIMYGVYSRTITFYSGVNKATSSTATQYLSCNSNTVSSVSVPALTAIDGWTKLGYRTDTTAGTATYAVTGTSAVSITPAYNVSATLYGVYSRTITFYSGVNKATSSTATQYYNTNNNATSSVSAPALTAISGWSNKLGYRTDTTASTATYAVTGTSAVSITPAYNVSATLYGVYSRTITFYSGVNKATSSTATQYYNTNNNMTSSVSAPALAAISNWTKLGYRTDTTASTATYAVTGTSAVTITPAYNTNGTLYGVYSRTLTISYDKNNSNATGTTASTTKGVYLNSNSTSTSSQQVTLASNGFTAPPGYEFSKWAEGSSNGTEYSAGGSYTPGLTYNATTFGKTMYAKWVGKSYTIEYYQGTTKIGSSTCEHFGTACTLTTYTTLGGTPPSGWTFARWSDSQNGTNNFATTTINPSTYSATVKLYAVFSKTFTFKSGVSCGTSSSATQYYNPTSTSNVTSITAPALTAISGWSGLGYRTNTTAGNKEYATGSITPAYNAGATMYGVYSRTITFYSGVNKATSSTATQYLSCNSNTVSSVSAPALTAIDGWTKLGYRGDTTASTATYAVTGTSAVSITPAYNTSATLYGVYSRTITFYSGVNKATSSTATQYYNTNNNATSSVSAPALTAIDGWSNKLGYRGDTTASTATYAVTGTSAVTITPTYSTSATLYGVYSRTITFNSGVSNATSSTATQYYNTNNNATSSVSAPALAAISNWTKLGYRTDTTASTATYAVTGTSAVTITPAYNTNGTLYGVYSRTLTISYNANGGTGTMNPTTKDIYLNSNATSTSSQQVTLASNGFTAPTGKSFNKWAEGSASGTKYSAGGSYTPSLAYNASSFEKTMYADWSSNPYTIEYYQGNNSTTAGSTKIGSTSCIYGESCTIASYSNLSGTAPSGWTFYGWTSSESTTRRNYQSGETVSNLTSTPGGVVKLYAVFSRTINVYSGINKATNNQSLIQYYNPYATSQVTSIEFGGSVTITEIDNWTALGYRDDTTASTATHATNATVIPAYNATPAYYAVYSRTITFYSGASKETSSTTTQYYNTNGSVSSISGPTPTAISGWTALGYRDDITAGNKEYSTGSISPAYNANSTLYGVYSRTINIYSGTNKATSSTATQYYNSNGSVSSISAPALTAIDNWTKLGYRTDTAANSATYAATGTSAVSITPAYSTSAVKLYGVYSRNYTAHFYSGTNKATDKTKVSDTKYYNTNTSSLPTTVSITLDTQANSTDITGWTEKGWRKDTTAADKEYAYGASTTVAFGTNFYSVYGRNITFYSGVSKATTATVEQYYNTEGEVSTVTSPTPAPITNWSTLGWRDDTTADAKEASTGSLTATSTTYYGVYSRILKINYSANGGSGTTSATTKTVYLNTNQESTSSQQVTLASNGFTAPSGKSFSKWTIDGTDYAAGASYNPSLAYNASSFEKTATANWSGKSYTVEYYQGNNSTTAGSTKIGSSTCEHFGTACTLTTYTTLGGTPPSGWTFARWSDSQNGTNNFATTTINPSTYSATVKLYVVLSRSVPFASGKAPTSLLATKTQYYNPYQSGTTYVTGIDIPTATAISGWTFIGYRANNTASATVTIAASNAGTSYKLNSGLAVEFRSIYSRQLTMAYNKNGGTGSMTSTTGTDYTQYYNSGYPSSGANSGANVSSVDFVLPTNGFTAPTGYNFSKWAVSSASGTKYDVGTTYSFAPAVDSTATVTMYAIWTGKSYTVSFNANNGSGGQTANVTATYGSAMPTISTTKPTRTGYTFQGWYDNATYTSGTKYYNADGTSAKSWDKTSATTLYAGWKANTYTISFNANNGSGGQTANVTATYGSAMPTISTTKPTRTGYTFMGWYDNATYTSGTKYYNADGTSARTWDKTSATTLYAGWKGGSYTINYYLGNGTDTAGSTKLGSSSCNAGTACTLTTFSDLGGKFPYSAEDNAATGNTNFGWTFAGWSTTQTGTTRTYSDGGSITQADTTTVNLYAVGQKPFYFNGGIAPTTRLSTETQYWNPYQRSTTYMTAISVPAAGTISGWTFCGYKGGSSAATAANCDSPSLAASTAGSTAKPTYNIASTMRSVYKRTNVKVQYNANGGSGTTSAQTGTQYYNSGYASGGANKGAAISTVTFTLRSCGFTYSNHVFYKWAEGSTSGTQYAAGATYNYTPSVSTTTPTKTMYAKWYSCPNGGTIQSSNKKCVKSCQTSCASGWTSTTVYYCSHNSSCQSSSTCSYTASTTGYYSGGCTCSCNTATETCCAKETITVSSTTSSTCLAYCRNDERSCKYTQGTGTLNPKYTTCQSGYTMNTSTHVCSKTGATRYNCSEGATIQ